uniref:BILBO1 N-terminal domain-containing protein n=1 Tax=Trypanosoma congolense (strain IL3000) TaxID=1068625 RepID=G0UWF0_TRYCI|nr:conserved hypothetical protein [Trypanosoma congolense IL3000]
MYTLLVCADIYGDKCNLEMSFPLKPTLDELRAKIVAMFSAEMVLRRPEGYPETGFSIARVQIYDDSSLKWENLETSSQLHEYDQIYVFQPQTWWHIDVQKSLPPPRSSSINRRLLADCSMCASPRSTPAHCQFDANERVMSAKVRLEEQRRRERALREELFRVREETELLEREVARELSRSRVTKWQEMCATQASITPKSFPSGGGHSPPSVEGRYNTLKDRALDQPTVINEVCWANKT